MMGFVGYRFQTIQDRVINILSGGGGGGGGGGMARGGVRKI